MRRLPPVGGVPGTIKDVEDDPIGAWGQGAQVEGDGAAGREDGPDVPAAVVPDGSIVEPDVDALHAAAAGVAGGGRNVDGGSGGPEGGEKE